MPRGCHVRVRCLHPDQATRRRENSPRGISAGTWPRLITTRRLGGTGCHARLSVSRSELSTTASPPYPSIPRDSRIITEIIDFREGGWRRGHSARSVPCCLLSGGSGNGGRTEGPRWSVNRHMSIHPPIPAGRSRAGTAFWSGQAYTTTCNKEQIIAGPDRDLG